VSEPFRILDLGCHDGFIGRWAASQIDGDVAFYGMDLHPDACEHARRRGYVEVVQANGMEAPEHFEPHSFDAVVAFEIIEHVPDPDAFLAVCERMLKPGGRIYVSTPDGTFGEGNNPHHLRALRAHDLSEILRRRGDLVDMAVGGDTVTTAAYIPRERLGEIAIYTGPGWAPWSPIDIEKKGLGGSETAAVRLAEELSALGWVVTVYGECEKSIYRDIVFMHHRCFDPTERRAAFISSRMPEVFDRPINAPVRLLWLHDTDCGDRITSERAERIDHVLTLSGWHSRHVAGMYPFLREKIRQTRNGIHLPYFTRELDEPRAQRLIYTSSPDRGLDVLLELWPKIKAKAPDAVFSFCYSDVYDAVAAQDPVIGAFRERLQGMMEQPGVQPLGSLPQPDLVRLMRTSRVWAHPSYSTVSDGPFFETSCIGAMEAQAAGCLAVASEWGALRETVRVGRLIGGKPGTTPWKKQLVAAIVEGLLLDDVAAWAQEKGPEQAPGWGWAGVAEQISGLLDGEVQAFEAHYPALTP
jgi:SAM-dependent methyltransferase